MVINTSARIGFNLFSHSRLRRVERRQKVKLEEIPCVSEHAAHSSPSIACIYRILIVCLLLNEDKQNRRKNCNRSDLQANEQASKVEKNEKKNHLKHLRDKRSKEIPSKLRFLTVVFQASTSCRPTNFHWPNWELFKRKRENHKSEEKKKMTKAVVA